MITLILAYFLKVTIGLRITPEEETEGTDVNQHGEKAYNFFLIRIGILSGTESFVPLRVKKPYLLITRR